MSFIDLERRQVVPASFGGPNPNSNSTSTAPFMHHSLSAFYYHHSHDRSRVRKALRQSRIGSVYEIRRGQALVIESKVD